MNTSTPGQVHHTALHTEAHVHEWQPQTGEGDTRVGEMAFAALHSWQNSFTYTYYLLVTFVDVGRINESTAVFQKMKVKLRHTEQPTQRSEEAAFILSPQPISSPPPGALAIEVIRPGTVIPVLSLYFSLSSR